MIGGVITGKTRPMFTFTFAVRLDTSVLQRCIPAAYTLNRP